MPLPGRRSFAIRAGPGCRGASGLSAAVGAGAGPPFLVVNADLPCVTARDLLALAGAVPDDGLALAAAADGTTNALALASADLFAPLYGPGSAARFAALAPSRTLDAPNLIDDVDTVADLERLRARLGAHTRSVLASLRIWEPPREGDRALGRRRAERGSCAASWLSSNQTT